MDNFRFFASNPSYKRGRTDYSKWSIGEFLYHDIFDRSLLVEMFEEAPKENRTIETDVPEAAEHLMNWYVTRCRCGQVELTPSDRQRFTRKPNRLYTRFKRDKQEELLRTEMCRSFDEYMDDYVSCLKDFADNVGGYTPN